jgi:serine/threonine protein kinase
VTDVVASALAEALRDRYTIERELGRGGMATVYLAREVKHGRQVALKVLRPELAAVLGRERFLAEIGLTARLDHPNILTLLDSGSAGEALFYAMPLVQGGSLRDRLQQERHLAIDEAVRIGSQVAAALEHAHGIGIIHRDIKPENILLHEGVPVLTDFGIALAVREAGGQRLTETGLVLGTPHYMSPEQATGDPLLDPRSDIYSLGAVVYEMLAGEPPFLGVSAQAIVARLITSRPTPLRVMRDTLPEWLAAAVDKSLAKIPADRYASAAEFARSLTTAPSAIPAAAAPSRRRRFPALAAIIALGLALALSAGWSFVRRVPARPRPSELMVAVLPPAISSPDSALSHLARDLAFTLAPNLTGAGDIRAVDPEAVVARLGNGAVARSRPGDLQLGRNLGAGRVVRGSLVRVGREVRWDLDLLSTENGDLVAQATTTALPESLRAFTDTATRSLLRQIWLRGQPPSPSLDAAVKTRSMPALKAFVTGESRIEKGDWGGAAEAYNDAVAADSSFWLAYWRLWYTRAWGADVDTTLFAAVRAHRAELPDRERLLIESCTCVADSLQTAIRLAQQVTTRFPDDWFAWLFLGDYLVHAGPVLGYTAADARAALQHGLALKPGLVDGWDHLLKVSLGKDTGATRLALHGLDPLGYGHNLSLAAGRDLGPQTRLFLELGRYPGPVPAALVDTVVRTIVQGDSAYGHGMASYVFLRFGFPVTQVEIDRRVLAGGVAARFAPMYQRSLASSWAARGAWDSAYVVAGEMLSGGAGEAEVLNRYRFAVFALWLGVGDRVAVATAGRAAAQAVAGLPADADADAERATLAWLDGLVAVTEGDRRGLAAARAAAQRSHAPAGAYIVRTLGALALRFGGSAVQLGEALVAADNGEKWDGSVGMQPQVLSINRLAEADAFLAAGDTARAQRLLVWHEADFNGDNLTPQLFAPLAYYRLARIEQTQGRVALAREHYQQFLRRYDQPVPNLRPLVEQARSALAKIETAKRGS